AGQPRITAGRHTQQEQIDAACREALEALR
ncbi:N-formimino-L-glutamate deiminase, partial [Erwinia sp. B116]